MDTLVLNSWFRPVRCVSWERAITLVLSGKAQVLEEYEDRQVIRQQRIHGVLSLPWILF